CIGCAACIDACDDVMNKVGYPTGLIRYTTENAVSGKPARILRPRIVIYAFVLFGVLGGVAYGIAQRVPLGLDVIRDRNTLFRETGDGLIENVYTLKILNKDTHDHRYQLSVSGVQELRLHVETPEIAVPAGTVMDIPVRLQADPAALLRRSNEISFCLQAIDEQRTATCEQARFVGPRQAGQ
ncbi:MAG: FixG Ig-like domain-containing protein, partial [Gammaproteobacteria bacterium]